MRQCSMVFLSLAVCPVILNSGCGGEEIESRWRDREIVIDGEASEWKGAEQYSDDDTGTTFHVCNDDRYLYLCLTTWNARTQQQILVRGLTVWFDPGGGDERSYGIDYPITKKPEEMIRMRDAGSREKADAIKELLIRSRSELILGRTEKEKGEWMFVEDAGRYGIEACLDIKDRILVYELKVPIGGGDLTPFPEGVSSKGIAGVGFEMGSMDVKAVRDGMMRDRPPGGKSGVGRGGVGPGGPGGPGGMEGGMPGGGPGGRREMMTEEIETWLKVRLAAHP